MDHTYSQFDTDLQRLRSGSTTMAYLVERQFLRAVDASTCVRSSPPCT